MILLLLFYLFFLRIFAFTFLIFIQALTLCWTVTPYQFNVEYVHMKRNVLNNIEKVFGKYIFYSCTFDTEDSKTAMSRHPRIFIKIYY